MIAGSRRSRSANQSTMVLDVCFLALSRLKSDITRRPSCANWQTLRICWGTGRPCKHSVPAAAVRVFVAVLRLSAQPVRRADLGPAAELIWVQPETGRTYAALTDLPLLGGHEPVRQRLQEAHDRVLLCVGEAQASDSACIHVVGRLRRGPARCTFASVMGLASRQDVARVVKSARLLSSS